MKKFRTLHLWIGIITSAFILIESASGLIMSEPWLIGGNSERGEMITRNFNPDRTSGISDESRQLRNFEGQPGSGSIGGRGGVMGFIRELHQGRIGGTDMRMVIDLTAIGMMILTLTGITMSVQVLRAQRRSRKRTQALETA